MKQNLLKTCLVMLLAVLGWGNVWADVAKSTFTSNKWAVGEGEPEWVKTGANATSFESASPSRGVQTTLANIKSSGLSLTNSTIKELGTIKSVTLVVSANGTGGSISGVKVGNTDFKNGESKTYTVSSSNGQTVTFSDATGVAGDIVISFASTATSKSLYVKSIEVTYETSGGGSTPTTYTVTVAENITGGTVTANPTTAAANATVTLTATPATGYEFGAWDVKDASNNTISVTDNKFTMPAANVNVSATFNAKATRPENEIFYESFDTNDGKGGNDGSWSGNIASNDIKQDNEGWVYENGSGADACAKFGTGSSLGTATTPALGQECDATLTFKAAAWNGSSEKTTLKLSVIGGGTISPATVTMTKGAWSTFTATLTSLTADSKIKFEGNAASNNRFFLDEVSVVKTGNATPVEPTTYAITVNDYIQNGTVSVSATSAKEGDVVTLTATPAEGYELEEYIVTRADNNAELTVTDNKFTMPAANVSVTATFKAVAGEEPEPTIGESETYNFAAFEQANDVTIEGANYTISLHKNNAQTAPQWNVSAAEARVYAKGSVDITSELNIVKVVYDYAVNANKNNVAPTIDGAAGAINAGTWNAETKTWTGSDNKVTLTTSGTAGNLGFKGITVYFEEGVTVYKALHLVAKKDDGYYATFSSSDVTFFTEDCVVSAVGIENGQLYQFDNDEAFEEDIRDINSDEVIGYYVPANTGVLVYSLDPIVKYLTVSDVTPNNDAEAVNMLRPASAAMTGDFNFYKLAYDNYETKTGLGFYWGAADGAAFTCKAGTAYLAVPKSSASNLRGFSLEGEGCTTGIESIVADKADAAIYNLQGQRVVYPERQSKGLQQGVNIVNGKKVIR